MMHIHYLRCIAADQPALLALLVSLGALVQTADEVEQVNTSAPAGTWDTIGPIYRAGDDGPAPVTDAQGREFWHANLATPVDVAALIPVEQWARWFILDGEGQITAPVTPQRIMAGWTPPAPPAPPTVPGSVTMRQARLALLSIGKLATVTTAINSLPSPHKEAAQIEWEYSGTVERHRPFVAMLAPALGLDDAALDALFTAAAKL